MDHVLEVQQMLDNEKLHASKACKKKDKYYQKQQQYATYDKKKKNLIKTRNFISV